MTDAVITVRDLHKSYGSTTAVDGVDLEVRRGEIFGVLGPNGAGKTTTVECVAGLRRPDRGTVRVLGLDPIHDGPAIRRRLGCQLQESELPPRLRVGEALELYASFYDHPADGGVVAERLGLTGSWRVQYRALSGGQKQRLSIALALLGNPEIAVLDELTTGLDPQARRDTWDLIESVRDSGVTIMLVTHYMDEAERLCDRLVLVDLGRVVALDTPAGVVAGADIGQELRFRTRGGSPEQAVRHLEPLPEVTSVRAVGDDVVVRGTDDVAAAVVLALAPAGITPVALAATRGTLEDAFVKLTGRGHASAD